VPDAAARVEESPHELQVGGEFVLVVEYVQKRLSTRLRQWGKQRI